MVIDLNKKLVTKAGLLNFIDDLTVFKYYINDKIELNNKILSPLRDEVNPSFGFFVGQSGEICFNDFALGGGDFVKFVQLKYGLTYFEALSKIAIDFDLKNYFHVKEVFKTEGFISDNKNSREIFLQKSNNFTLGKKKRSWEAYDYAFWLQYGIDIDILTLYNVEPISYIFIEGKPIKADKYAYCFTEYKDNKETYKIYQPFNKDYKWLNNHNDSVWQGWSQLPKTDDTLIITKSLKDVMAIKSILNIPSVSLQSESVNPKPHIINELKSRFKIIFLLYDNDFDKEINYGRQFGNDLSDKFEFIQIEIPDKYKSKDFSDLIKYHDKEKAKKVLQELIKLPF